MHKNQIITGMDEAGRGSWAGPVVAAAVILPKNFRLPGLTDSKLLSAAQRDELFIKITENYDFGVGIIPNDQIDKYGLLHATFLAFEMALDGLKNKADKILIDGRDKFKFIIPHESIIKGDLKIKSISAASVVAKVTRDRIMIEYAKQYPNYGFDEHKGYGTSRHQRALNDHGACKIHRFSYAPIMNLKCEQIKFL